MKERLKALAQHVSDDIARASTNLLQSVRPSWRLGPSTVGEECERQSVYKFRWFNHVIHVPRMLRLFDRGNDEELRIVRWLRMAGWSVYDRDPATGNQWRYSRFNDHFGAMIDAKLSHPAYGDAIFLGEFKTHNTKSFTNLVNKGVSEAKAEHVAQMQMYGELDGQFAAAIYVAVNKNDDDIDIEAIEFDPQIGRSLLDKAHRIINAVHLPRRISENASFFKCKFCDFSEHCHGNLPAALNCRSCRHSMPTENSSWLCTKYNFVLTREQVATGCEAWEQFE